MANPGYGKRSAPDQLPRTAHDFAHLPPREAAIAAYIDRLPNGADISVKTLAKTLPYGQCALRTALNNLQRAGHLRRGREHLADSGSPRWITRTWFSRTARDDDWWAAFTRGDVPQEQEPQRTGAGPPAPARTSSSRPSAVRPRPCPCRPRRLRGPRPAPHGVVREGRHRRARTPGPDRRPPDPGPQPGRPRPQPPDQQAPAGAQTGRRTPTPPRTGVREVRRPGPPGGSAGRRMRAVPGRDAPHPSPPCP